MGSFITVFILFIIPFALQSLMKKNGGKNGNRTLKSAEYPLPEVVRPAEVSGSDADRIYAAKKRLEEKYPARAEKRTEAVKTDRTGQQQPVKISEPKEPAILARAMKNAGKLLGDTTLQEMEEEHGHTEQEAPVALEHSKNCPVLAEGSKPAEEIMPESLLGTTEDLMVKGYDGNLTFARDFVGEAQEFLTRISYR